MRREALLLCCGQSGHYSEFGVMSELAVIGTEWVGTVINSVFGSHLTLQFDHRLFTARRIRPVRRPGAPPLQACCNVPNRCAAFRLSAPLEGAPSN